MLRSRAKVRTVSGPGESMKVKVTHVEGSKKGNIESLEGTVFTVGRDPSNNIVFDPVKDDRVSTKHAALTEQGGGLIVTDLGSRNGTLVNGKKISGPTPVPSGTLVQFGENGPMVMVAYEAAAAAPAPAAPPKKGGGGGCAIVAVLAILLFAVIGIVVIVVFLHGRHGGNPWASYGPGSSFEMLTETHMDKPVVMDSKAETKETIVSRTDDAVKVKVEVTAAGQTMPAQEMEIPLKAKGEEKGEKPLEEKRETVTVPAGTFDCRYTRSKSGEATSEVWMSDDVPVPVKTVTTTDAMKSTLTLTKVEKK